MASVLSLTLLCEHWQQQECVNQSVCDVRRLSSLSAEERKLSLTPLHQNLCAHCFCLLGKDIGQEPSAERPLLHDGRECNVYQQPPGVLLFSPQALANSCPEVFHLVKADTGPEIHLKPRWPRKPPWVFSLENRKIKAT